VHLLAVWQMHIRVQAQELVQGGGSTLLGSKAEEIR
jgi:hypothetical protein